MVPRRVVIARWTGRGSVERLRDSTEFLLRHLGTPPRAWIAGYSVVVEGRVPLSAAARIGHLPGVSWVAVGFTFASMKEAGRQAGLLAKRYVRRGERFSVEGEGIGGAVSADVSGAVTSGVLDVVKGSMVSESAKVRFRAAFDGKRGVVGVEVAKGAGGVSTGDLWASCLVSGGRHSAALAWCAQLMGYRVRLVHVKTTERSLLAVARLYAELSHRAGPQALELEVKERGTIKQLAEHLARSGGEVFGGFAGKGKEAPREFSGMVSAPLYLMPEEQFASLFESLGLVADDGDAKWGSARSVQLELKRFEGWADDVSAVLDGLR